MVRLWWDLGTIKIWQSLFLGADWKADGLPFIFKRTLPCHHFCLLVLVQSLKWHLPITLKRNFYLNYRKWKQELGQDVLTNHTAGVLDALTVFLPMKSRICGKHKMSSARQQQAQLVQVGISEHFQLQTSRNTIWDLTAAQLWQIDWAGQRNLTVAEFQPIRTAEWVTCGLAQDICYLSLFDLINIITLITIRIAGWVIGAPTQDIC